MNEIRKPSDELATDKAPSKPTDGVVRTLQLTGLPHQTVSARRAGTPFRSRLFAMLLLFAVVPSIVVTAAWVLTTSRALPLVGATSAWERVGASGDRVLTLFDSASLSAPQQVALQAHAEELRRSVEMAKRFGFMVPRSIQLMVVGALLLLVAVALGASRVAGHLARQLSRPLDELVGWTRLVRSGDPLPVATPRRGAPEFELLRSGMRRMADGLAEGRVAALEAERSEAFRESARRFAHELKNPLTPIRFAIDRLRRTASPEQTESVEVLAEESTRLDTMARAFAQFGRLPDGAPAEIDMGELVSRVAQSSVPDTVTLSLDMEPDLPLLVGYHDPLARAVTNVLLNAVEATAEGGTITILLSRDTLGGAEAVRVMVRDSGLGIPAEQLPHIFDPYVTSKAGGTGLGLAIVKQTITAHSGRVEAHSEPGHGTVIHLRIPTRGVSASTDPTSTGVTA